MIWRLLTVIALTFGSIGLLRALLIGNVRQQWPILAGILLWMEATQFCWFMFRSSTSAAFTSIAIFLPPSKA